MEIAAGKNDRVLVVVDENERIVRYRVGFSQQHRRRVAHLIETRAHHLRLATQTVRVLHARTIDVRSADRASRQQLAINARRVDLPPMTAHILNPRVERRVAAETRVNSERAGDECRGYCALRVEERGECE